jgi:CO/xanthine dehydrogenase FAD-binding subunit
MADGLGWAYEKLKASGGAYGSANAAALVRMRGGMVASVRLVVGAVAERLIDASDVAAGLLLGRAFDAAAGEALSGAVQALVATPLSDAQGDGPWRRAMAGVVARRAIAAAIGRAKDG